MNKPTLIIKASKPTEKIPLWAILERRLFETMNNSVDIVLQKYLKPNGYLMWPTSDDFASIDGLDDAYESFHNWPLFYVLGGADRFLELSHREYDAITKQFSKYDCGHGHPMVVNEYEQGYDWMHQGEGYLLFYLLNLADPANEKNRQRSIRYANFYSGLDPSVPNYDSENKVYRCCYMGSMGPAYRNFDNSPWEYAQWKDWYGLPYADVPGCVTVEDIKKPENAKRMGEIMTQRLSHSDTLVNLFATTMVMNAYLHTGDKHYKQMILEYINAWRDRTMANGGLVPDNVGPSGIVGECMNGKWYGGYYGWTWPHGFYFIADAIAVAAEHDALLTGNYSSMDWLRQQVNQVMNQGIIQDETLYVPQKKGDPGAIQEYGTSKRFLTMDGKVTNRDDFYRWLEVDGWYEFAPMSCTQLAHLWFQTLSNDDMEIIKKTRDQNTHAWERLGKFYSKYQGGQDPAWLNYLDGGLENYPEMILQHNLNQVYGRLKMMREDSQDPKTYSDAYLQMRNPISVEGLVHLTMGGPMPIYNGGMLMVSIRHFDADLKRPGLPPDVAALVSNISRDGIVLTLINLNPTDSRSVLVQAGAFSEHSFSRVVCENTAEANEPISLEIDSPHVIFDVGPGSSVKAFLGINRFCRQPSYQLPWD